MMDKKNTALALLVGVQYKLKAPKDQKADIKTKTGYSNSYKYRNAESILQAAKELCKESGLVINCTDELVMVGERYYIKATASAVDVATGDAVSATGWAREPEVLASMGAGQITGASSSYARKYALCGLFAVDGSEDEDELAASGEDVTHRPQAQQAPQGQQAGGPRQAFIATIVAQATQKLIPAEELTAIVKARYGKSSSQYLSTAEAKDFAENFDAIVDAHGRGKLAKYGAK